MQAASPISAGGPTPGEVIQANQINTMQVQGAQTRWATPAAAPSVQKPIVKSRLHLTTAVWANSHVKPTPMKS